LRQFNHDNVTRLYLQGLVFAGISINLLFTYIAQFSFEYYIPIRPLLLIFRTDALFFVLYNFVRSLIDSMDVLFSFICLMSITSLIIMPLFEKVNENKLANSYSNFMRSMFTSMIFTTTGENHNEVYWQAKELHWWYIIYHIFCALCGLYMFVPIFISRFEEGFTKYNEARRIRNTALKRAGIVAAFILLDANSDHSLDRVEFSRFMKVQKHCQLRIGERDEKIDRLWAKVNVSGDGCILLEEFVPFFDNGDVFQQIFVLSDITKRWFEKYRKQLEVKILSNRRFKDVLLIVCIIQAVTLTLHGWSLSYYNERALDLTSQICWGILTAEILIRILCMGYDRFFFYSQYPPIQDLAQRAKPILDLDMIEIENLNRFEVSFVLLPSIALLCFQHLDFVHVPTTVIRRTAFSFSLFRIMSLVKKNSIILVTIWQVLPDFISLATFIFLVMFMFALFTCNFFHNAFNIVLATESWFGLDTDANFDSIGSSLNTVFQMFIGEGWHHILWTVIESQTWASGIIIIIFVILSTVLLASVFTAMLLSKFSILNRVRLKHVKKQEIFGRQQGYSLYSGDPVKILATHIFQYLEAREQKSTDYSSKHRHPLSLKNRSSLQSGLYTSINPRAHLLKSPVKEEPVRHPPLSLFTSSTHYGIDPTAPNTQVLATAINNNDKDGQQIFEIHKVHNDKQPLKNGDQVIISLFSSEQNKPTWVRWSDRGICTLVSPSVKTSRQKAPSDEKQAKSWLVSDFILSNYTFTINILGKEADYKGLIKHGISKISLTPQVKATNEQQKEFWDRFDIWQMVLNNQLKADKELKCHYSEEPGNVIWLRDPFMKERWRRGTTISETLDDEDPKWDNTEFTIFRHQVDNEGDGSLSIPGCYGNYMHKLFGCNKIISENVGKKKIEERMKENQNQWKKMDEEVDQQYRGTISPRNIRIVSSEPERESSKAATYPRGKSINQVSSLPKKISFGRNPRSSGGDALPKIEADVNSRKKNIRSRSKMRAGQPFNKRASSRSFVADKAFNFTSENVNKRY